jgi:hypothetical protein
VKKYNLLQIFNIILNTEISIDRKTYFDSLTTTCKHFVVIVGSNDLTSGATVTQVHQDLQDLKELACIVKIQRLCPQYFTTVS